MVIWGDNLYYDRFFGSERKRNRLITAVNARTITWPEATGIFLSKNEDESLMLIRFVELLQPLYEGSRLTCIGVAGSAVGAEALTRKIIEDCYKSCGDVGVDAVKKYVIRNTLPDMS